VPDTTITRGELMDKILQLPDPRKRAAAVAWVTAAYINSTTMAVRPTPGATRDIAHRRSYAGKPSLYFRDVLGWVLTDQQERMLELIEQEDKILLPSGTNIGKSFVLAGYGIYRFDAVGALEDPDLGLAEQGAKILLPGPDAKTVQKTIFAKMLVHAMRAEARGFLMPGYRTETGGSVLWRVRPEWDIEAFSPPRKVGQEIAHTASGRHHRNMIALVEEASGVDERVMAAVEGMCSSQGNKIIAPFNPAESGSAVFVRSNLSSYRTHHISALDHPNVKLRLNPGDEGYIPGAVAYRNIDARVRDQCKDFGPYPKVQPDKIHKDIVYALPHQGARERGRRKDGNPGHPDAPLRVYRPGPMFEAQVLGQWPSGGDYRLFSIGAWDESVARWIEAGSDPEEPPDMVGCDPARFGSDDSCAAPRWGPTAEELLRGYMDARDSGGDLKGGSEKAVQQYVRDNGCRIGEIRVLNKGDGPSLARQLVDLWPSSPFNIDEGGGVSCLDHLRSVLKRDAMGVVFGSAPPEPTPGEPWSENLRTAMYVRFARVVAFGLVDVPNDPQLREEVLAHELKYRYRTVEERVNGRLQKVRKPSVLLIEKDEVKKRIGRSPDKADAAVQSLLGAPVKEFLAATEAMAYAPTRSGRSQYAPTAPSHEDEDDDAPVRRKRSKGRYGYDPR